MKTKSVLVLTNSLNGLWNFRKEIILGVIRKHYKVLISSPEAVTDVKEQFEAMGCQVIITNFKGRGMNPIADILLLTKYVNLIKRSTPLCVLTYTIKPNIYGGIACRLCGVAHLPNITGLGDAIENGGKMKQLAVLLYRLGLKKSHVIFFQNSANLNFCLKQGIVKGKPVLLPGSGVNLRYHTLQEYPDKSDDVIKILFIGRLKRSKGVEELFKSAAEIKAKYGDKVEFQVLGKEVEGCHTRLDEAVNMGLVTYLGSTTDVRPFLKRVHCTIMPSYYEGMSNVNLESSANGRPVITTDIPGCREIVDDGNTGFLAKHQDSKSLTEAIERFVVLTYEQKREMGLLARQKVEQEFDRQIVIDAYLKEIR